jgi:hypothetical protein
MSTTGVKADLLRDIEAFTCGEEPSPLLMLGCPRIENWSTEVRRIGKEFKMVVIGEARRHPDFGNGEPITTSAVVWFDRHARFVRTFHRVYSLGEQAGNKIPLEGIVTE